MPGTGYRVLNASNCVRQTFCDFRSPLSGIWVEMIGHVLRKTNLCSPLS